MSLGSAWKKIKKSSKLALGIGENGSWSKWTKSFYSPEQFLTAGAWNTLEYTPGVVQGWSNLLGATDIFQPDIDRPEQTAAPELVGTQQTATDGGNEGGNANRRRRISSYATSGGALGDSSYAGSGIRSRLG